MKDRIGLVMADVRGLLLSSFLFITYHHPVMCAVGMNDVSVWMWIHMLLVQPVSNACDRGEGRIRGFDRS